MTCLQLGHYVYSHHKHDDGAVFYIGKGSGNRAYTYGNRNKYWKNIVAKHGGFKVHILASKLTSNEALNFERIVITKLREDKKIKLSNLTDGGDGSYNPSIETREKMRIAKIGKKLSSDHKIKISEANKKRQHKRGYKLKLTDESRLHRKNLTKNQIWTDDRKKKISEAKLGYTHTDETKQKISDSKRGKPWSEARRIAQKQRI